MKPEMIINNRKTKIFVVDEADAKYGNVHHKYSVTDENGETLCEINFQHGPIPERSKWRSASGVAPGDSASFGCSSERPIFITG